MLAIGEWNEEILAPDPNISNTTVSNSEKEICKGGAHQFCLNHKKARVMPAAMTQRAGSHVTIRRRSSMSARAKIGWAYAWLGFARFHCCLFWVRSVERLADGLPCSYLEDVHD